MRHKFEFYINERVMVYCQRGGVDADDKFIGDWAFLPAVITHRHLEEPHTQKTAGGKLIGEPQYEGDLAEIYDMVVFDGRLPKGCQSCNFYGDRLYHMGDELVPRANLIEEK